MNARSAPDEPAQEVGLVPLNQLPLLRDRTKAFYQDYLAKASPEIIRLKALSTQELQASGIGTRCLRVGDAMPAFSLPTPDGRMVSAAELLAKGPLVISFYRGGWCGYCNLELSALQDIHAHLSAAGAKLVAICPELPERVQETADLLGLDFDILCDAGNAVAAMFGLSYPFDPNLRELYRTTFSIDIPKANGDDSYLLPITATYLVGVDGTIVLADTNPDHTQRLEPRTLVETIASGLGRNATGSPA